MRDPDIARSLEAYSTADLCSSHEAVQAMHSTLSPLFHDSKICGPARTARTIPGQNAAIHRAVQAAGPGEVVVVASGGTSHGPFGGILAGCCRERGIEGVVIDSTVRDTAEIRAMLFPVFCLGASPNATRKTDPGEIDVEVDCGGVRVRPGDFVVGDDDGVVVVPVQLARDVARKAQARVRWEDSVRLRLAGGENSCEILGIEA